MKRITSGLLFFVALLSAAPRVSAQWEADYIVEVSRVKAVTEIMDSLLHEHHYKLFYPTKKDSATWNKYGFAPNEKPTYTPAVYEQRLKELCTVIPMDYNPIVHSFIMMYVDKMRYTTQRLLGLQHVWFPMFEEVLERENMPLELKYLAVIESALNPKARSWAGALGLWQFMYGTAALYNVRQDSYIDERMDPYVATVAAARHLRDLYKIYNDWHLAIAAYNCGPGWVNRAIELSGGNTNFWDICKYLPHETRGYVPAFIGATYALNYAAEHNIYPIYEDFTYFSYDTVSIVGKNISLSQIAKATNTDLQLLRDLNPALKLDVIPYSTRPYILRAPKDVITWCYQTQLAKLDTLDVSHLIHTTMPGVKPGFKSEIKAPANSRLIYYQLQPGEKAEAAAKKFNVKVEDIHYWNQTLGYGLSGGETIKIYIPLETGGVMTPNAGVQAVLQGKPATTTPTTTGQPEPVVTASANPEPIYLAAPKTELESNPVAANPTPAPAPLTNEKPVATPVSAANLSSAQPVTNASAKPQGGNWPTSYIVQPGDTLWDISQKFDGLSIDALMQLNNLSYSAVLQVGQVLKLK